MSAPKPNPNPAAEPDPPSWPFPAEPAAAERLIERFIQLGATPRRFAKTVQGAALLAALGGNAPYLADLALRESATLISAIKAGPDATFEALTAGLRHLPARSDRAALMQALRLAKRRAALTIAIADIGGMWSLTEVTRALSSLAASVLGVTIDFLLRELHDRKIIKLPAPAQPARNCGFVALALGKLGAGELNYSSDIDLVLLYDPENPVYPAEAQPAMARLARDLVGLLSTRDEDGYVFRVDLRLRPNPAATPAVVSLPAALSYYESQGRTWERAAFSKARPIAGDLALGAKFLGAIRPFIWRKHLDFAAIADIHGMKRQIDFREDAACLPGGLPGRGQKLLGHDVKLGRGGIREIEFIVQTLSLVWGGQDPDLQIPETLKALLALAKARHLPAQAARELAADYQSLRKVEHRLQMVADRQTHALPGTEEGLRAFIVFLGEPDFLKTFPKLLARVQAHFAAFFDAGAAGEDAIDPGTEGKAPEYFAAKLKALGFTDVQHVAERLRAWANGNVPALRSERARELLESVRPTLLAALARQPEPDRAFIRFDTLISRQRAGIQLLSLFQRNPALLDRLAAVLGAAPALAEHLAQDAQALETLLAPAARFAAPKPILARMLKEAEDFEDAVAITRRFVRREEFHLSVATLEARLDADTAGRLRSNLAAAAINSLLSRIITQHEARYGRIKGMKFGVVALGKAGSGEMLAGSDLDLMLIYDHAKLDTAPTQYFVRLAHALTGALTAQGPEGPIYKVDMRLRPSGNQGPVAVSLAAFRRYHAAESWVWERLALTRACVLAATPGFQPVLANEILLALTREQEATKIRAETQAMLTKLNTEISPAGPWDVKYRKGGMIELAFIAEALQLIHGPQHQDLFRANTAEALRALQKAGHLTKSDGTLLQKADFLWRTLQGINRITGLRDQDIDPPPTMLAPLLRATNTATLPGLRATMAQTEDDVHECFTRNIAK
jgi:[glutamine synthetase] adenylyltransferase / [glutamine synthetase]-adenylyl-L-tyrosine phosphorylase